MAKTIKIGHASTSSNALQNQVLVKDDYNVVDDLEYNIVLRPKTRELAEKSATSCEAGCANDKIGYSQSSRLTLYNKAKEVNFDLSKINTVCHTDCSAFMSLCAIAAGVELGAGQTCGSMEKAFRASDAYTVLKDKKYLTSTDYLQRGDILVRDWYKNGSRHTVMVLENGCKLPSTVVLNDFFTINIKTDINKITSTTISAVAEITVTEHNKEKAITKSVFNNYIWEYTITKLDSAVLNPITKKLNISHNNNGFTINVEPNTSYLLKLTASEKDKEIVFNSPNIVFTTPLKASSVAKKPDIKLTETRVSETKRCKTYLNLKDGFKQAIVYHR